MYTSATNTQQCFARIAELFIYFFICFLFLLPFLLLLLLLHGIILVFLSFLFTLPIVFVHIQPIPFHNAPVPQSSANNT